MANYDYLMADLPDDTEEELPIEETEVELEDDEDEDEDEDDDEDDDVDIEMEEDDDDIIAGVVEDEDKSSE